MNLRIQFAFSVLILGWALKTSAQGTAFNYQGQLNDAGSPANGIYDFRFAVYNSATNVTPVTLWQTNSAVPVSNGLFNVTLDFGSAIFTGTNYWLAIGVQGSAETNFTTLQPRQPILPVPYAIFANSASNVLGTVLATQLTGTVPSSQIAGTYSNPVGFTNTGNSFAGSFNGTVSGNGSGLTGLNASQLTTGTVADTRLSANVALLDHSQTYSGNNQFSGANNFTNWNNNFTGNFFGNGLIGWVPTNALAIQAERDHGYLLGSPYLSVVTLPPNFGLQVGDIVRVSGSGGGGWLVAENSGQSIIGNLASYQNAVAGTLPVSGDFRDVAASSSRSVMYAVGQTFYGVQRSTDGGRTWNALTQPTVSGYYNSVACSADGSIVYAVPASGNIQKSTNGGYFWTATTYSAGGAFIRCSADGSKLFASIACSGDGTYQAALSGGSVYISTNSGTTWSAKLAAAPANIACLAASSDCTRLLVGVTNGLLYASANQGVTWKSLLSTNQYWSGAWMSPDGSKIAVSSKAKQNGGTDGSIYTCDLGLLPNTTSTNSTICGSQGAAVELQYVGNGMFMPISSSGVIWAN